ncbi:hypothetical protein BBJ28_00004115 [Nothophytophthora sp. Chile5]|nr:hypothetical protein BBJ28_00004115 [Nothophytophthora sp. Chile5]
MVQATFQMRVREKMANVAAPPVSTTQDAESNGNESAKAPLEETYAREQQKQAEKTSPTPSVTANSNTRSASETNQSLSASASQPKKAPLPAVTTGHPPTQVDVTMSETHPAAEHEVGLTFSSFQAPTAPPAARSAESSPANGNAPVQAQKRQLPGPEDTRDRIQKALRSQHAQTASTNQPAVTGDASMGISSQPSGGTTGAVGDGMSLNDRVKAMYDEREKSPRPPQPSQRQPVNMNMANILSEQRRQQQGRLREQQLRQEEEQLRQQQQQHAEMHAEQTQQRHQADGIPNQTSLFEELQRHINQGREALGGPSAESGFEAAARAVQEEARNRDLVVRGRSAQQPVGSSDAMVAHQPVARGGGGFNPSMPSTGGGDDDGLRAVWISDYDHINARIMELEAQIVRKTEEGHAFVHRFDNITIPDDLKLQISQLRAQLDTALGIRFKSVIRVLIFSTAVRAFAQQNEHANIWSDVPEVLNASHRRCAELASEISDLERSAQGFRRSIDTAVSSGQMQNVPQLGALLKDVERKIQSTNAERGKQFSFMFQFSEALRRMVVAEWGGTLPGEDYAQPRLQG